MVYNKIKVRKLSIDDLQELLDRAKSELEALQDQDASAEDLADLLQEDFLVEFIKKEYKSLLLDEPGIGGNRELVDSFEKNNIGSFDKFIEVYFDKTITQKTEDLTWLQQRYGAISEYIKFNDEYILEIAELSEEIEKAEPDEPGFNALQSADSYIYNLSEEHRDAYFEEVERHESNYPRILKSDHPEAFKKNIFVFSYMDSNFSSVVEYVDLEGCTDVEDVKAMINNAIDFDDLHKLEG